MERSRTESLVFVVATSAITLGTLFAVTWVAGFGHVAARLRTVDPVWFASAFGARGGFAVDVHAFKQAGLSDQEVRVRVLGLGALEYALLAPAACVVAIQLLADGHSPSLGLTLPWAIAVPLGFLLALWAVEKRESLRAHAGRRRHLAEALDSIHVLKTLFVNPRHLLGPLGSAIYWFGDIFCL